MIRMNLFSRSRIRGEDYYEILQVSRHATDEEVKQAYRRLALQYRIFNHNHSIKIISNNLNSFRS